MSKYQQHLQVFRSFKAQGLEIIPSESGESVYVVRAGVRVMETWLGKTGVARLMKDLAA